MEELFEELWSVEYRASGDINLAKRWARQYITRLLEEAEQEWCAYIADRLWNHVDDL